ncbi:hypothetical protein QAD02_004715 [Eretmocerus hayati]|uniref:Uncharacterized protein n=1 Tax=Eretmocerus hayati TaxID=131215 RepID=A0ACC2NRH4_9HYME|nr:hypothetical protein QAD02_004715 [Eretmocerus hayati]
MPGIHVHTLGRLHWENQDEGVSIAVPGSYWLCHRNTIYKFTFKFHKTIRNTPAFPHSKELMKVIRKVIKLRPEQGQHYSTKNLLVTYNHASWTRQDKLTALMKFSERPAALPFSHAFTLTVNFLNQNFVDASESRMGTFNSKLQADEKLECSTKSDPTTPHDVHNSTSQDMLPTPSVSRLNTSDIEDDQGNSRSLRSRVSSKDLSSHQPILRLPNCLSETQRSQSDVEKTMIRNNGHLSQSSGTICGDLSTPTDFETEVSTVGPMNGNDSLGCDTLDLRDASVNELWAESSKEAGYSSLQNDEYSDDPNCESACLPYQYLIEKDIERELEISRNAARANDSHSLNCSTNLENSNSSLNSENFDPDPISIKPQKCRSRSRQESRDDPIPPPEIANLRSSDITDLVMKGRMFTIRQDENMVTVVEQKTKLELDEVLENSEKVETKEGDPCLLNSSLLRLEKMITRMQEPNLSEHKYNGFTDNALLSFIGIASEMDKENDKSCESDSDSIAGAKEDSESFSNIETTNCWTNFFTDRDFSNSTLENFKKILEDSESYINDENQDDDLELKLDDEDDDVPEGMMQYSLENDVLNPAKGDPIPPSCERNSTNSKDKLNVPEVAVTTRSNFSTNEPDRDSVIPETAVKDRLSKQPRMISNELISNHQIPSVLLKTLNDKNVISRCSLSSNNNTIKTPGNQKLFNGCRSGSHKEGRIEPQNQKLPRVVVANEVTNIRENINEDVELTVRRLRKRNIDKSTDSSHDDLRVTLKPPDIKESDESLGENSIINSNGSLNHNTMSKIRRTRSNSSMQVTANEPSDLKSLNQSPVDYSGDVEIKTGDVTVKDSNDSLLVNALNDGQAMRHKKKTSVSQDVSKFCKTVSNNGFDRKDVSINVWKLLSDLENGVEVVIERLNSTNIPR